MADPTLTCPHCKCEIRLTESLAAPMLEAAKSEFAQQLAQKDREIIEKEKILSDKQLALADEQRKIANTVTEQVAEQMKSMRLKISEDEALKAKQMSALDLEKAVKQAEDAIALLKDREEKLAAAQATEALFIKKQRELDDKQRELDLTIQKSIQSGLAEVRESTKKEVEESNQLKAAEKDHLIVSLQKQIGILQQKAEQGSQQLQGEVQELELEALLRRVFPHDLIEPVAKGEFGGDVLQRVMSQNGRACGSILWECKRTKNWSDSWLLKLREDQRAAKADLAIIVSQALPKEVDVFDEVDGVWVVSPRVIQPVATALRQTLLQLSAARQSSEGQETKTQLMYQYATGPQFRQRVEAIVEAFSSMRDDLAKERQLINKQWAKREKQIENVMIATVGMWGDLQGISGRSLQELEGLEIDELPEAEVLQLTLPS